jgi:xanthine dehydrogenase iron-sulfur cluster and FAD-binding subunit A
MRAATQPRPLTFVLNGRPAAIDSSSPTATLLDYLRANGLTGAKEGCAEGECGACAVSVTTPNGEGSCYRTVNSCLIPLMSVAGREILTVEGLAPAGTLADAQTAMAAAGGSQCGYCTPGFVMATVSLLHETPNPSEEEIRHALEGNLCRCTGYHNIVRAVHAAAGGVEV